MATIKLKLNNRLAASTNSQTTIYLAYTHNQKQKLFNTGEKVSPENWDAAKQRVKANERGCTEINKRLQAFYNKANEAISYASVNGIEPTFEYISNTFAPKDESTVIAKEIDFFELWQEFINKEEQSLRVTRSTLKAYLRDKGAINRLCIKHGIPHKLSSINKSVGNLIVEAYRKEGYSSGSTNGGIKNLKVFLKWAKENGYPVNEDSFKIGRPKAERTTIQFLDSDELKKIENAPLPSNLAIHRDLFLLFCYTGLRHSDLVNLKPENFSDTKITLTAIKTHEPLRIPIIPEVKAILERYAWKLPKVISNQKLNYALKKIGLIAGLTSMEQVVSYKGVERVETTKAKWELLTCHVGRRTFITQSLSKGIRPEVLMKITGHKDIKTLMLYVKINSDEVEREMLAAWK